MQILEKSPTILSCLIIDPSMIWNLFLLTGFNNAQMKRTQKSSNGSLLGWFLYNANDRNLDIFVKKYIFSETISSGRAHFAI